MGFSQQRELSKLIYGWADKTTAQMLTVFVKLAGEEAR
ncbi:hypothetical protein QG37_01739 [Candidozyma auris]|nr:hypothetical protein QG37_01739 [[Candida] auris]